MPRASRCSTVEARYSAIVPCGPAEVASDVTMSIVRQARNIVRRAAGSNWKADHVTRGPSAVRPRQPARLHPRLSLNGSSRRMIAMRCSSTSPAGQSERNTPARAAAIKRHHQARPVRDSPGTTASSPGRRRGASHGPARPFQRHAQSSASRSTSRRRKIQTSPSAGRLAMSRSKDRDMVILDAQARAFRPSPAAGHHRASPGPQALAVRFIFREPSRRPDGRTATGKVRPDQTHRYQDAIRMRWGPFTAPSASPARSSPGSG